MADEKHFRKTRYNRDGWWKKQEDGQPIPDYVASCGRGFRTRLWAAHHILPETSIRHSAENVEDPKYLTNVQWITPWNINNSENMIGLPHVWAYQFLYAGTSTFTSIAGKYPNWTRYLNNEYTKKLRDAWQRAIKSASPEPYPIHIPTSWGHAVYNDKVKTDIEKHVWDKLNAKKKQHDVDAEKVAAAMVAREKFWYGKLEARKAPSPPSKELWDKVITSRDKAALKPFTMHDVASHPLFG